MILAGTGHRPQKIVNYDLEVLTKFAKSKIPKETTKIISGMAIGWDTAIALAAIGSKIPLVAAIPFENQPIKWPKVDQDNWRFIVDNATEVVIISEGDYKPWFLQKRNEWMVDHSDRILALWDGSSGGTSNCFKYAVKKQVPIINVWKEWENYE